MAARLQGHRFTHSLQGGHCEANQIKIAFTYHYFRSRHRRPGALGGILEQLYFGRGRWRYSIRPHNPRWERAIVGKFEEL